MRQRTLPGIEAGDASATARTDAHPGPRDGLSDSDAREDAHRASPRPANGVEPGRRGGLQDEGDNIPGGPEPGQGGRDAVDDPKEPADTEHVPKLPPRDGGDDDGEDDDDDGDGDGDGDGGVRQPPSPDEHRPGRDLFDSGP